jgi:hypothetical protein
MHQHGQGLARLGDVQLNGKRWVGRNYLTVAREQERRHKRPSGRLFGMQAPKLDLPCWFPADRVEQETALQNFSEVAAEEPIRSFIALDNNPLYLGLLAHEVFGIACELQKGRTQFAMRCEQFAERTYIEVNLIHEL